MSELKNHKWENDSGIKASHYKGECKRCGIIRYKDDYGGYQYLDPRIRMGTKRMVSERPPCNPEKNVKEMGMKCYY